MVLELEYSYHKMSKKIHTYLFLKLAFSHSNGVAIPGPCVINLFKYLLAFI